MEWNNGRRNEGINGGMEWNGRMEDEMDEWKEGMDGMEWNGMEWNPNDGPKTEWI